METSELRAKQVKELHQELESLLREAFNLRIQKAFSEVTKLHRVNEVRRNIARIKTIISEKKREGSDHV